MLSGDDLYLIENLKLAEIARDGCDVCFGSPGGTPSVGLFFGSVLLLQGAPGREEYEGHFSTGMRARPTFLRPSASRRALFVRIGRIVRIVRTGFFAQRMNGGFSLFIRKFGFFIHEFAFFA
jgi:hypothetical protein